MSGGNEERRQRWGDLPLVSLRLSSVNRYFPFLSYNFVVDSLIASFPSAGAWTHWNLTACYFYKWCMFSLNILHVAEPNGGFSVTTLPNPHNPASASCLLFGHPFFISFVDFSSSVTSLNMDFLNSSTPVLFSLCKWSPSSNWVLLLLTSPFSSQASTSHLHSAILSPLPCFNWPHFFMPQCPCTSIPFLRDQPHNLYRPMQMKTQSFLFKNHEF